MSRIIELDTEVDNLKEKEQFKIHIRSMCNYGNKSYS